MSSKQQGPIVVGVDGTEAGERAVRFAVSEALLDDRSLRIVHIAPESVPLAAMLPAVGGDTLREISNRIVNDAVRLAHDAAGPDITIERVIGSGSRVRLLTEAAEDGKLLVLGHRDRSVAGRVFTTSTCSGVASRAACPVICVPPEWQPTTNQAGVVVGIKDVEHASDALDVAFRIAAERETKLTVLHAWRLPTMYDDIIASRTAEDGWITTGTAMIDESLADWRARYPKVDVHSEVRHEFPAVALVDASATAELLVLGRHGHHAGLGYHLGTMAHALIRESRCPVAIAPSRLSAHASAVE